MAKTKRIGKGKNAFSVLQSDYDANFAGSKVEIIKGKVSTMQDAHHIRKEVGRIEAIKEVKQVKEIKQPKEVE